MYNFFSVFQTLILKTELDIPEEIYHLACQQSDLGVIKLLVKNANKQPSNPEVVMEEGTLVPLGSDPLKDFLFGDRNEFKKECLNNKGELGEYMKQEYFKVFGQECKEPEDCSNSQSNNWSEVKIAKALFELQNQDKENLSEYLFMNITLDMDKNFKMLVLSNKKYFDNASNLKQSMLAATQNSNNLALDFLTSQFPDVTFDQESQKEIFKFAIANAKDESILTHMLNTVPILKHLDDIEIQELFASSNETGGPFLAKNYSCVSDQQFFKLSIQNAIKNQNLNLMNHLHQTIPGTDQVEEEFLRMLLKDAISSNFAEAIDFIMEQYPQLKNINEVYANELFMAWKKNPKSDTLQCLKNHYRYECMKNIVEEVFLPYWNEKDFENCKSLLEVAPELFEQTVTDNEWFASKVIEKAKQCPNEFGHEVWAKIFVTAFKTAVQQSDDGEILSLLEMIPQLFRQMEASTKSKFIIKYAKFLQHEAQMAYVLEAIVVKIDQSEINDVELFLDEFPDVILNCNLFTVLSVVLMLPSRFGIESFSNIETVEQIDIDMIYHLLDKVKVLKNSESDLIRYLIETDLRSSDNTLEVINKSFESSGGWSSTPLIESTKIGLLEIVKNLIQKGAEVNAIDGDKQTALHYSAYIGHVQIMKLLLENGASVNSKSTSGTPLHLAAKQANTYRWHYVPDKPSENRHLETVKLLLQKGASTEATNCLQQTPFHHAADHGNHKLVELLIQHNAHINARDYLEMTPLHCAAFCGHPESVKVLLSHGANKNLKSKYWGTPLEIAYDQLKRIKEQKNQEKIPDYKEVIKLLEQDPDNTDQREESDNFH